MRGLQGTVALFFATLVLLPLILGGPWGPERVLFALSLEAALLAVAAPMPMSRKAFLVLLGAGTLAVGGHTLLFAFKWIGATLLAQLVLAGYGAFLRGVAGCLSPAAGPRAAYLAGAAVGIVLLVSPLGIDPILDLAGPGAIGSYILRGSLALCPPASIFPSLFDQDWLREGSLYTRTRFVSSRPFTSPRWFETLAAYLLLWGVVIAIARLQGGRGRGDPRGDSPGGLDGGSSTPLDS